MKQESGLTVGSRLDDRYELVSRLGQGGFGVVYRARQLSTGQTVAIKVLLQGPEYGVDALARHQRFEREMELIGQLKHPNIVRLIDSGHTPDGRLYTVLEYIDGKDLAELLDASHALAPVTAKRLMTQVLEALASAHELGIVHRDLKPGNIMVTGTGRWCNAMVLDFGIATLLEDARGEDFVRLTQTGQIHGTPAYMAPEQLQGQLSEQSDIYAWGLVFIECLSGVPVVDAESVASAIFQQLSPQPARIPDGLPSPLQQVLRRATAKDPAQRYASANDALRELAAIHDEQLEDLSIPSSKGTEALPLAMRETLCEEQQDAPVHPATQVEGPEHGQERKTQALEDKTESDPRQTASPPSGTPPRVSRGLLLAAILLSLLGLVGTAAFIWVMSQEQPETSCPEGQSVSKDSRGHCCWPGQAWNGERCVGTPSACPEGLVVNSAEQACTLLPCGEGRFRPDELHCCWQDQAWSDAHNRCIGTPSCPEKSIVYQENCLLLSDEAWVQQSSCEAGNQGACVLFALMLQDGRGAERSDTFAVELLREVCELDNPIGCYHLGVALRIGIGVEARPDEARQLFEKACLSKNVEACFDWARMLERGEGGMREHARAQVLIQEACGAGHPAACDLLGSRHHYGIEASLDPGKAQNYYRMSCGKGYMYACTHLAWLLAEGPATQQVKADTLLQRACEAGDGLACSQLARRIEQSLSELQLSPSTLRERACEDGWRASCP
ncbi:MAG: serine/threonine-protein kinase [Myxococcota bacterium]|nr:serine/threonine-protein kinase [Myxococcota bacterium]